MDLTLTNSQTPIVVSSNTTALNDRNYTVVANTTFTDPSPVEGKGFKVFVRNGTAVIGGISYTVWSEIIRIFHSGAWANYRLDATDKVTSNAPITGATKTKITYDAKGLVTSATDATTADIADSTNKRYVTDAQLTVIGNTSNTNTGDETQSSILSKLGWFYYNRITESTAVTGTTAETIIENITIPANTYANGGIIRSYNNKFRKVGNNGILTIKLYIGPTANNLTGATPVGTFSGIIASQFYAEILRTFTATTSGILGFSATQSSAVDTGNSSSARLSAPIDWTIEQNFMITVQLGSGSDSVSLIGASLKNF